MYTRNLECAVTDLAQAIEEHGAGEHISCFSFVESRIRAAAQRRIGDPVERALDLADVAQRFGEGILAEVSGKPLKQRGWRNRTGLHRRAKLENFRPVFFKQLRAHVSSDEGLQKAVLLAAVEGTEAGGY